MATLKPTAAAVNVLKECTIDGNTVKLPPQQLERALYNEVRKHLEIIGGKWTGGKTQAFVFKDMDHEMVTELLEQQANGEGRNLKKEFQFFATPPELAERMVQMATNNMALSDTSKFLEPSAGDGALIKAIRNKYKAISVYCFEAMDINRKKLAAVPGAVLLGSDFIEAMNRDTSHLLHGQYDIIIANPPFSNNQDIDHILAMYKCLKMNGRMVVISSKSWTFGQQKKQSAFREWLREVEAFQEELPEDTFKASGTKVGAVLLVIDKLMPDQPAAISTLAADPATQPTTTEDTKPNNKMKKQITLPAGPLAAGLKKIKEVISSKPSLDILTNILVKVRRTDVQLVATDLIVTIQDTIEVTNDADFGYEFLLPFGFFYDVVTRSNGLDITIDITDGKKGKKAKAVLSTLIDKVQIGELDDAEDFPKMPEFPQSNSIGVSGDIIDWMGKAATTTLDDKGGGKSALSKIYIGITPGMLTLASTDAEIVLEKTFEVTGEHRVDLLVSTKIAKALAGFKETSISWSDTHIAFVSNGITMIGTIQDEQYPKYKALFPKDAEPNLTVLRNELASVMNKALLTDSDATLYLRKEKGHVMVESFNVEYNRRITTQLDGTYLGDCEQITISPKKLLLLLKQVEYNSLSFSIRDSKKSVVITTDSDDTYRSLIAARGE